MKLLLALMGLTLAGLEARATLLLDNTISGGISSHSHTDETAFLLARGLFHHDSSVGGPVTFLSAFGNPAVGDFPPIVDGALDSIRFSVVFNGPSANISYDLTSTGFVIAFVLVQTTTDDGKQHRHFHHYDMYASDQQFDTLGAQEVHKYRASHFPHANISHVSFYGVTGQFIVPDPGSTLVLLGMAAGSLCLLKKKVTLA